MIRLVSIGGSGDIYMVCALLDAFKRHHNRDEVEIISKRKYAAIASLFRARFVGDDGIVGRAESDISMQRTYENTLLSDVMPFYVHPCFLRSEFRVDKLTTKPDASQADMYRMILRVPLDAPLTVPEVPRHSALPNSVILIPDAVSWPNTQPGFWKKLAGALAATGRQVFINSPDWSLDELLARCAAAEWVIGPQCGVMSILVTGRFPCRKTLASASLTDANKKLSFLSAHTFPYAYVTKFSNADYDVEEFEITDSNHDELVSCIVSGSNGLRLWAHDPRPVMTIQAPMAPGDFLDRLAVLTVKRKRFSVERRAAIEREYQRYSDICRRMVPEFPQLSGLFDRMLALHEATYDLLEHSVPAALANAPAGDHVAAIRMNKERVELKRAIDAACRAPYTEVKSYYGDGK